MCDAYEYDLFAKKRLPEEIEIECVYDLKEIAIVALKKNFFFLHIKSAMECKIHEIFSYCDVDFLLQ